MSPDAVVVSVLSLLGVVLGAWATYRSSVRSKEIESEATPYAVLASRVTEIETQVQKLQQEQFLDRAYMRLLVNHWPIGRPLPRPMPDWLQGQLPGYDETPFTG